MADYHRPPTTQAAVLAELRRRIVDGDLPAGAALRQEDLAADLGVSRVPIREALRMLEAEGLVGYEPHRGYRVASLGVADLEEIYRLRALIEDELARTAVPTRTTTHLDQVRRLHAELAELESAHGSDRGSLAEANRAFHFALLQPGPRARRILRTLWDASDAYRARWFADPGNVRRGADEHRDLLAAFEAADAERVVRLLDQHRQGAVDRLVRILAT